MKAIPFSCALLVGSFPALAGPEAGAILGYSLMSASSGADPQGGLMLGARGGFRTDTGTVLDAQFLRNSSSSAGLSTTETVVGLGVRYFIVEAALSPLVAGHLNYHMGASAGTSQGTDEIPNSSGIGVDLGGGLQIRMSDLLYTDIIAQYAIQMTGDARHNTLGFGVGFGVTF